MHLRFMMKNKTALVLTVTCTIIMLILVIFGVSIVIQNESSSVFSILIISTLVILVISTFLIIQWVNDKLFWYESILDNIPFPVSVTDNNMNWTFINKPVEDLLNIDRSEVSGKACKTWNAAICNTQNCGINCLKRNQKSTHFDQLGRNFRVDVNYIFNINKKQIGHVEVVQDITDLTETQNAQGKIIENVRRTSEVISSASSELTEKTKENATMANQAASLTDRVRTAAKKGYEQMNQMIQAVQEINEANLAIGNVMKTINSIASQTSILALNASVEAVRAGESGRSFSVVAEEVRNLAAMCTKSADDTSVLVGNCIKKAELGAQIAGETASSLEEIIEGITKSDELMKEIAESSFEQSREVGSINDSIENLGVILSNGTV